MGMDFTAIDVETANRYRSSVCSVALVRVRDDRIVDELSRVVRPVQGLDSFENTWIHGIGPDDVVDAPSWDEVLPEVLEFAGSDVLVAHNASFDSSVLTRSTEACGLPVPTWDFVCTLRLARSMLALGSYSLPFVVRELGVPPFGHHQAVDDARAAAHVALALVARAAQTTSARSPRSSPDGPARSRPPRRTGPRSRRRGASRASRSASPEPCARCNAPRPSNSS